MVVSASAARLRLGVWGVRAMQAGGFGCRWSANFTSKAGTLKEASGTFAKKEKAEEEQYFQEQTKEHLATLKKQHEEEITHHKKEIERLQKEIEWHKQNIKKLKDHNTAAVSGMVTSSQYGQLLSGYRPPSLGYTQGTGNSQLPQSKYAELLAIIEELGKEIRPTYAGSKSVMERLK
ncbi:hypothetical protein QTO34_000578 [Cnephaeus nilssonii]|uniref:ATPase inhibitor, mitochondrial n=1 Tax=Cnephaeus nilssonii TaxID=3371016 RepID=A0AA40IBU7_CNENI|nr:hypothetical protein QTO34_000578 [Eptesicus nilssonii]